MSYVVLFSCFPLHSLFFWCSSTRPGQKHVVNMGFKMAACLCKAEILEAPFISNVWKKNIALPSATIFHKNLRNQD